MDKSWEFEMTSIVLLLHTEYLSTALLKISF